MDRPIIGFHQDKDLFWIAQLSCGHGQHARHRPPFQMRAWVETEEGRAARMGTLLDCVRCDRREIPDGYAPYRTTASFCEGTVPRALLERHSTKAGVWGLIHVERGRLAYRSSAPAPCDVVLEAGAPGVVLPEVEHEVEPLGSVQFHLEFWRRR